MNASQQALTAGCCTERKYEGVKAKIAWLHTIKISVGFILNILQQLIGPAEHTIRIGWNAHTVHVAASPAIRYELLHAPSSIKS